MVKEKQNAPSMVCGILQCYYANWRSVFSRSFQFSLDLLQRKRRVCFSVTAGMRLCMEKLPYKERLKHGEGMKNVHHVR